MRIVRRADSAGASRWVRRAETLVRSIKQTYETKREFHDGYLVEGKRTKGIRHARVMDIPGRFVPFGHADIIVSGMGPVEEAKRPIWVPSPTRLITLERKLEDGDDKEPVEYSFVRPEPKEVALDSYFGRPPPPVWRSIGISHPMPSPGWITQTRLIYSEEDPVPQLLEPVRPYPLPASTGVDIDYSNVSAAWVLINAWGVGNAGKLMICIDEAVIETLFGAPLIRKQVSAYRGSSDTRAWATVVNANKVALAVWLSDGDFAGEACSLGLIMLDKVEGRWGVYLAERIQHADLEHPLFAPHWRTNSEGVPITPAMRSNLYPWVPAIAADNHKVYFSTTLRHEMDGLYTAPGGLSVYQRVVATGVFRAEIDLATYTVEHSLSHVNVDTALAEGVSDMEDNLTTSNGVVVSQHIDYPWVESDWVAYCGLLNTGSEVYEVIGMALGTREILTGAGVTSTDPTAGTHKYREGLYRYEVRRIRWEEDTRVEDTFSVVLGDKSPQPYAEVGAHIQPLIFRWTNPTPWPGNVLDGGSVRDRHMPSYVGLNQLELHGFRAGTNRWIIMRLDLENEEVTETPLPDGARQPVPTCYAPAREKDDEVVPHRGVITYKTNEGTVVELRRGDDVVATALTDEAYELGIFYLGNPLSDARYGQMEGL